MNKIDLHKNICDYIGNTHLIENKPFKVENKEYVGKLLSYIESGMSTGYIIEGFHEYVIIEEDTGACLFFIRQEFSKINLSGYDNNYKYKKPYVIDEDDLCDGYGSLGRW